MAPTTLGSQKRGRNQPVYIIAINFWPHVWAKWLDKTDHLVGSQGADKRVGIGAT